MKKKTIWIVLRNGKLVSGIAGNSHYDALLQLGRWLVPSDIALSGSILHDIGREATSPINPFVCDSITIPFDENL